MPAHPATAPVALVTGGAVRVGRALSLGLAEEGYDLAVNYYSSGAEARDLVERVEGMGRRCVPVQGDVGSSDDVASIVRTVDDAFGRLDVLVNSASIFGRGSLLELEESDWDRVMAVNLKAPFLLVRGFADRLREAGGCVVNIVDLSAFEPWTEYPHHAVSKAGLLHLTRVMARVLAPRVRVNAVAPGTVLLPPDYTEEQKDREIEQTLVGHLGSPGDVLKAVLFLVRSPFVSGEVVVVDGGARWRA